MKIETKEIPVVCPNCKIIVLADVPVNPNDWDSDIEKCWECGGEGWRMSEDLIFSIICVIGTPFAIYYGWKLFLYAVREISKAVRGI